MVISHSQKITVKPRSSHELKTIIKYEVVMTEYDKELKKWLDKFATMQRMGFSETAYFNLLDYVKDYLLPEIRELKLQIKNQQKKEKSRMKKEINEILKNINPDKIDYSEYRKVGACIYNELGEKEGKGVFYKWLGQAGNGGKDWDLFKNLPKVSLITLRRIEKEQIDND